MCISLSFSSAICQPECVNGGVCIAPGVCQCPRGFHGETCQEGEVCLSLDQSQVSSLHGFSPSGKKMPQIFFRGKGSTSSLYFLKRETKLFLVNILLISVLIYSKLLLTICWSVLMNKAFYEETTFSTFSWYYAVGFFFGRMLHFHCWTHSHIVYSIAVEVFGINIEVWNSVHIVQCWSIPVHTAATFIVIF